MHTIKYSNQTAIIKSFNEKTDGKSENKIQKAELVFKKENTILSRPRNFSYSTYITVHLLILVVILAHSIKSIKLKCAASNTHLQLLTR